jgi:MFS family permease
MNASAGDASSSMQAPRRTPSEAIERTYYVIAGVYTLSASLIWGINTLFLLESGLSLMQAFLANAIFTGSMAVFEVPTGLVADTRGRRLSFLLSVTLLTIGTLAYVAAGPLRAGLPGFIGASIILGLGYTFYSGAVEAWLVDALQSTGYASPVDRVLARGSIISSIAMLIGSVSGGLLGSIDLTIPYFVRCVLLVAAFLIAYRAMHDTGFTVRALRWADVPGEMARVGRASIQFGWREPHARLAILAGAAPAIFLEWGYHAWQPYFIQLLGREAVWILGVVAAATSLAMAGGSWLVERLTRYCGRRTTLLLGAAIVYTATSIGVGLAGTFPVAVFLYLIGMVAIGVFQPVRQAYLHAVVPREQRATVLSLAALVGSGGSMGGQVGLGWLAANRSLATGYVAGGIATALAIPWLVGLRRIGGAPDQIIGKAGRYMTCEALALPAGVQQAAEEREVA